MKRGLPLLASRIFGTPLAIEPGKLEVILSAIGPRVVGHEIDGLLPVPAHVSQAGADYAKPPITTIVDGVALLDVAGTLVHRSSWMDAMSGLQSYQQLAEEFRAAMATPSVNAILLAIDSGGGEVGGLAELAAEVFAARGVKPVYAIASDAACSAAYWLGSAAEKFFATESAIVGSIGVVWAHLDVSESDKKMGVKVTHVHAGARKVDGNPHEPLGDEGKATLQALVDKTYGVFVDAVAKHRKGLSVEAIRLTEARVYVGSEAIETGLVDGISTTREVLAELVSRGAKQKAPGRGVTPRAALPFQISFPMSGGGGAGGAGVVERLNGASDGTESPDATVAPATQPPPSGEESMKTIQELQAALDAANKEITARDEKITTLTAENAELRAQAAGLVEKAKADVIEKHVRAGRVVPAMRADVELMAKTLSPEELDARLSKWATVTRVTPTGKVDATPPEEAAKGLPAVEQLNAIAKDLQAKTPGMSFPDAFDAACRANPKLFAEHRAANTPRVAAKKS